MALNVSLDEYVGKRVEIRLGFGGNEIVKQGVFSLRSPIVFTLTGDPTPLSYTHTSKDPVHDSVRTKDGNNYGYRVDS